VKAYFLSDRIGWFGDFTGYEQLPKFLTKDHSLSVSCITPLGGSIPKSLGKLTSLALRHGSINQAQAFARLQAYVRLSLHPGSLFHILYGEEHAQYWRSFPSKLHSRTVVTIHQPPSQWTSEAISCLQWVRHAILLYRRDLAFFQSAMPNACLQFIPYGVDVDFFCPSTQGPPLKTKRLLYNGVHLRNVAMLRRIVPAIMKRHPDVAFDFLVPLHRRAESDFGELLNHPSITWHAGLDDHALLSLYRQSYLMLLPMNDSGANTAVVEALSCGLPIATTDVGGIRDYGGDFLFPVVANDNDESLVSLVSQYLSDEEYHRDISQRCRLFAEQVLDWNKVAEQHLEVYAHVCG
jgi:glycosyltransferase involved in cell wall biosynthesis